MRVGRRTWTFAGALAVLLVLPAAPATSATVVPNVFSVRLQGWAVQSNVATTSTAVIPGAGYSFAKVNSTPALDGGTRDLDMAAIGANGQDEGLPGVVLFTAGGSLPSGSSTIPGYAEAFFPTFEGKSAVSEKCAANQAEAKETPECREQPGPYAYAQVFDDQEKPRAIGSARSGGQEDGNGETSTLSEITPKDDGTITSVQRNVGRDLGVPGTPITVESFIAETLVTATTESVSATGECSATVKVGGQQIASNRELQQALGPFSTTSGVKVTYVEPSAPAVVQKPDGGLEVSCRGPQFVVFAPVQGGTGTTYTYGRTFSAAGKPANRESAGLGSSVSDILGGGGAIGGVGGPTGGTSVPASTAPTGEQAAAAPAAPPSDVAAQPAALVEKPLDLLPIGAWTALAATLLPLAVWLLLGVTGSLARGSTRLRLPPFRAS